MRARNKEKKLTLEEYLDFLHSNNQTDLTSDSLNQVIFIHGFRKIHRVPKKVLIEAVSTINLVHPARSTLEEDISPCAFLDLEDIVEDLKEINWQECCVTSIQTLKCNNMFNCNDVSHALSCDHPRDSSISRGQSLSFPTARKHVLAHGGGWGCKRKRSGGGPSSGGDGGGEGGECYYGSGSAALGLLSLGYP